MANNITRWRNEDPPNLLLAIDPGASLKERDPNKRRFPYAGAALFQWGQLAWAGLVKCPQVINNVPVPAFARPNTLVREVCRQTRIARHGWQKHPVEGYKPPRKNAKDRRTEAEILGEGLNVLAVERPILYTHGSARPQDIIDLREIYGAFMGGIDSEFYSGPSPEEWKGSLDGVQLNERVCAILNASEQMLLVQAQREGREALGDHVLDGVGLGLFVIGRAGKAMVV